jgi:hypothetical protein
VKPLLGAALVGLALSLSGCAAESTDSTLVTVYKSPT